ncbi:testis-expressed protein 52-like [Oncorhynchus tshawytscha]|uniref:testis-expressed protein 52-like n=1 Tax=Oncorhynchus tshawytscha TaxID=74940 RepID=UPI001C3E3F53|nr:testis-expressed protein 52-like [Oncorhynchus tshawytscha]
MEMRYPGFKPRLQHRLVLQGPPKGTAHKAQVTNSLATPRETFYLPLPPTQPRLEFLHWVQVENSEEQEKRWRDRAEREQRKPQREASLPPPSRMGPHTLARFFFQWRGRPRNWSGARGSRADSPQDVDPEWGERERLLWLSHLRAPPLDSKGNILPPSGFKRRGRYGPQTEDPQTGMTHTSTTQSLPLPPLLMLRRHTLCYRLPRKRPPEHLSCPMKGRAKTS